MPGAELWIVSMAMWAGTTKMRETVCQCVASGIRIHFNILLFIDRIFSKYESVVNFF
jgi:hypothetical protein